MRRFPLTIIAFFLFASSAMAASSLPYKPGLIQSLLNDGKAVFVDFKASWCSTCARQSRVIAKLRKENPTYNSKLTFVSVDWDDYRKHEVTTSRNIPRRSTLVLLKGNRELGRIVAGTSESQIKALMDKAL